MNIGRGLGKFAEGLANGYATGMKNRREQEVHEAQMKRIKDDQDMTAEIRKLGETKAVPSEGFVVVGEDGSKMVYADPAQASDAAALAPGSTVTRKIIVAGKQFDHEDDAMAAVEAINSPLAKARQAANIALKYNRPDLHEMHMKAYKMGVEANRQDLAQQFGSAQATGDLKALADVYNKRLPNGMNAEFTPQEDGTVVLTTTKGGKVQAQVPFKGPAEAWSAAEQFMLKTPDNMLEIYKHNDSMGLQKQSLALQERGVTTQEKVAAAGIKKTDAEVAQMPEEMGLKRTMAKAATTSAGAAATSAGASVLKANTDATEMAKPKPFSYMKPDNTMGYAATTTPYDPEKKAFGLKIIEPEASPAMQPMPRGNGSGGLLGGLGLGGPAKTDAQRIAELKAALPPKNIAPTK